jgi:hypothetical protein
METALVALMAGVSPMEARAPRTFGLACRLFYGVRRKPLSAVLGQYRVVALQSACSEYAHFKGAGLDRRLFCQRRIFRHLLSAVRRLGNRRSAALDVRVGSIVTVLPDLG